ncbi:MAG: hypothetical protein QXL04_05175 [Metallosphaera sp.]
MRKNIVVIGLIVLVVGLVLGVSGFLIAKGSIDIISFNLSPGQEKTIELRSGENTVDVGYNSSLPPKILIEGTVSNITYLSNGQAFILSGTSPSVNVENNLTEPISVTIVSTEISRSLVLASLAFLIGLIVFFVGIGIIIYGLVRR